MDKIRVAVIGAGNIGGAHLDAYAAWPEHCEIVAVADPVAKAAEERAGQVGVRAFTDYARMLAQMAPDAVSICAPPNAHLEIGRAVAAHGMAALCEKPPARTLAETQALVDAFDQADALLQFAFCHRFHQPIRQAQQLIQTDRLGRIVQIHNRFGFRFARAGQSWFTDSDISGGGILIDTLVHSIDIFRALVGEIDDVVARTLTTLPVDVEDTATILVTGVDGCLGTLTCSWVTPVSESEVRIYGTEGEAVVDYRTEGGLTYRLVGDDDWTALPFDQPGRFVQQAGHFLDCVRSGSAPLVGGRDALAVMQVIDAAYRTAA